MKANDIFKRISSLSAAIYVLLAGDGVCAKDFDVSGPKIEKGNEDEGTEPLILKPSVPKEMTELEFVGHQSHSSHTSGTSTHYSGYAPSYSYPTPVPAPIYTPRPVSTPAPVYHQPTPSPMYTPLATPTPQSTPAPTPTPLPIVTIGFKNGAQFVGRVVVKAPTGITFETLDKKVHKIPRSLLSDQTVLELALGPVASSTPIPTTSR